MKKILLAVLFAAAGVYVLALVGNVALFYICLFAAFYFVIFLVYACFLRTILKRIGIIVEDLPGLRRRLFWPILFFCFSSFVSGRNSVFHYVPVPALKWLGACAAFFFSAVFAAFLLNTSKEKVVKLGLSLLGSCLLIAALIVGSLSAARPVDESAEDQLKSLPYLTWIPMDQKTAQYSGVVKYDRDKAFPGINMVSSQDVISVLLLDMQGKVLHSWEPAIVEDQGFHYAQMTGDGDLWAIIHNKYAVRLGWDSQVKGKIEGMTHHDIAIPERGEVCLLDRAYRLVFFRGLPIPVLDDRIVFYSQEGEKKGEVGVYKFVAPHISPRYFFREYFFKVYGNMLHARVFFKAIRHMLKNENFLSLRLLDLLHTNSVQIIDREVPGLCKKGDLLISVRNIDLIAIIDPAQDKLLWHWGPGEVLMQHHATLLDNGHILLFDNGDSKKRPYSRVIELDPMTKKTSWEYKADPPEEFYSAIRGAAQRLPNGNTLITESDKGRVFEVTKDKEVVWEFYNPEIDEKGENRVAIYRFTRITDPENYPALSRLK